MPDLSPGLVAQIDQVYAASLADLQDILDEVAPWMARGPGVATTYAATMLLRSGWTEEQLAGLAATAIAELIRARAAAVVEPETIEGRSDV